MALSGLDCERPARQLSGVKQPCLPGGGAAVYDPKRTLEHSLPFFWLDLL
jgi:hypothetical protein